MPIRCVDRHVLIVATALALFVAAAPARADAPPPPPRAAAEIVTRWPVVLPCPHPSRLLITNGPAPADQIEWSSANGHDSFRFDGAKLASGVALPGGFPAGRVDRFKARLAWAHTYFRLDCPSVGSVAWNSCGNDSGCASMAAAYPLPASKAARPLAPWTAECGGKARLREQIAAKVDAPGGAEAVRAPAIALARDAAAEVTALIARACTGQRCTERPARAAAALAAFRAAKDYTVERTDAAGDPASHTWAFKVTAGEVSVEPHCGDEPGGEPGRTQCAAVDIIDADGPLLYQHPWGCRAASDRLTFEPPGSIQLGADTNLKPVLLLDGSALRTREPTAK